MYVSAVQRIFLVRTSANVEHCGESLNEQPKAASFGLHQLYLQHACMSVASRVKSGLLPTSIDPGHTAWLNCHA